MNALRAEFFSFKNMKLFFRAILLGNYITISDFLLANSYVIIKIKFNIIP